MRSNRTGLRLKNRARSRDLVGRRVVIGLAFPSIARESYWAATVSSTRLDGIAAGSPLAPRVAPP